jgi:hypothetical protein
MVRIIGRINSSKDIYAATGSPGKVTTGVLSGPITPKELPKMILRVPEIVDKKEEVVEVPKIVDKKEEIVIEIPKLESPQND